jgi:hypothetical protein
VVGQDEGGEEDERDTDEMDEDVDRVVMVLACVYILV